MPSCRKRSVRRTRKRVITGGNGGGDGSQYYTGVYNNGVGLPPSVIASRKSVRIQEENPYSLVQKGNPLGSIYNRMPTGRPPARPPKGVVPYSIRPVPQVGPVKNPFAGMAPHANKISASITNNSKPDERHINTLTRLNPNPVKSKWSTIKSF